MAERTVRRLWNEDAACGFCLHAEPGAVWCTGVCQEMSLTDLVQRVRAILPNAVRLEMASHGMVKPVKPHVVPDSSTTPFDRAARCRSSGVEHVVSSLQLLEKRAAMAESTARRLVASRTALTATEKSLSKAPTGSVT